jgi:hypothetical protein
MHACVCACVCGAEVDPRHANPGLSPLTRNGGAGSLAGRCWSRSEIARSSTGQAVGWRSSTTPETSLRQWWPT